MSSGVREDRIEPDLSNLNISTSFRPNYEFFFKPPPFYNPHETKTSEAEDETLEECRPLLINPAPPLNAYGISRLRKDEHISFLSRSLTMRYPARFVGIDASRPWFLYWGLTGLYCLGEDVSKYAERVTDTFRPCQNPDGGFGSGHGQLSHVAASYAAVLSLLTVGGTQALESIDRKAMWQWLGRMKCADGGFTMAQGGEEDIRGAYCSLTIICVLNLPLDLPTSSPCNKTGTETFLTNLGEWISRCQTFEGGIGGAPTNEAHGAYAFCGLACLAIIGPPKETFSQHLDLPDLIRWLSAQQRQPYGGFAGRTNKLIDGCYSHWVGGCWALIQAALAPAESSTRHNGEQADLWSREGLVRYILNCAQNAGGGLRDKPSKPPDAYHSCYNLAGLSAAQNVFAYDERADAPGDGDDAAGVQVGNGLTAAFKWRVERRAEAVSCSEGDWIEPLHPVFVVPLDKALECRRYFESKTGF